MNANANTLTHSQKPGALGANLLCFAAMITWAAGFPAAEVLLDSWGSIALMMARLTLVVISLMLVWWLKEGLLVILGIPWWKSIRIGGIAFGLGSTLLMIGQQLSDAVTPAIAAAMMPIAGAALEMVLDGRKLHKKLVIGILLAIAGGYLATGASLQDASFGLGAVICLISVFLFAWGTRAATRELEGMTILGKTTSTVVGAWAIIPIIWIFSLAVGYDSALVIGSYDAKHIGLLLIFSILAMAISQLLWIAGTSKLGILLASLHMNAIPFYVMTSVVLFLGESWNSMQAIGAALVGLGVIIAQSKTPTTNTP